MEIKNRILIVLSFLSLPVGILIGYFCNQLVYGICFAIAAFMIFSYIAHIYSIADFFFGNRIPYYITLPGSFIPFVIVHIFYYLLVGLKKLLFSITKRNYLSDMLCNMQMNMLYRSPAKSIAKSEKTSNVSIKTFTNVELQGYTLTLDLDYLFANPNHEFLKFTDNFGDCWLSYDHRKTFIRQKDLLVMTKLDRKVDTEESSTK